MSKINLIQIEMIPLSEIEQNQGQINGLPANPRLIRNGNFEKLKKSIMDNPEMLSLRELLVYKHGEKYVTIGGNMRLNALQDLEYQEAPCKIIPQNATIEQLKAYAMKDNAPYGEWDYDMLANEWDVEKLKDWGVGLPDDWGVSPDDFGDGFSLPSGEKSPFQQMTFTFADEQADMIRQAIDEIKQTDSYKYTETFGNENANGNALFLIVRQWAEQKK